MGLRLGTQILNWSDMGTRNTKVHDTKEHDMTRLTGLVLSNQNRALQNFTKWHVIWSSEYYLLQAPIASSCTGTRKFMWITLQISGTAMVLDEIINHVQSLQRQVEVRHMFYAYSVFYSRCICLLNILVSQIDILEVCFIVKLGIINDLCLRSKLTRKMILSTQL